MFYWGSVIYSVVLCLNFLYFFEPGTSKNDSDSSNEERTIVKTERHGMPRYFLWPHVLYFINFQLLTIDKKNVKLARRYVS